MRCALYFLSGFFFFFFFYDTVMYAVHVCKQHGVYGVAWLHVGCLRVYVYTVSRRRARRRIHVHKHASIRFGFFC